MKGDFSMSRFRKEKHYRKVNMQQGRVQLDSDWNEQADIHTYYERSALQDIIGNSGTLSGSTGFSIISNEMPLFSWDNVPGSEDNILKEFIVRNFGSYWIEVSQFVKSSDGRTISALDSSHSLSITLNSTSTIATLTIDNKDIYEFIVKEDNDMLSVHPKLFSIGAGHYYVDGILCENETEIDAFRQPDLPLMFDQKFFPVLPTNPGTYLAYLDIWERHLTALDDPEILEPALSGADTTTRTKIVWQVKLLHIGNPGDMQNFTCLTSIAPWDELVSPATGGTLQARSKPQKSPDNQCILPPGEGYRRLENQLYRVEIHDPTEPAKGATFKWSRDNGVVVTSIKGISGVELTVADTGRDKPLGFAPGQWVEVIDNRHELLGIPGTLTKLTDVKGNTLTFDSNSGKGDPLNNENYPQEFNPKARRWDSPGSIAVTIPAENDGYIELEDGIEVKFSEGIYKINDYWLIPARTAKGDVEWPRIGNAPEALSPEGIKHHFCRLALLEYDNNGFINLMYDCRKFFPATTALNGLSANTGIISLNLRQGHDLIFGPFEHWMENLSTPPAIILGLSEDPFNEIDFEASQNFKAVNVNLTTFKIIAPSPLQRELNLKLRWWAVPGQEKGVQVGKPVPSIAFDPPAIRIGDSAIIRVIDPKANKDPLKVDTFEIIVTASISDKSEESTESNSVKVNAAETGPNTGIFEVQIQIIDKKTVKVGDQTLVFNGTFELLGGFVEATYLYSVDGIQKTVTDVAEIPKVGTGSIAGKVTDDKTRKTIQGAIVRVKGIISGTTDDSGSYILPDVPVGMQTVGVSKPGFSPKEETVTVNVNQMTSMDFTLTPLIGTIKGKVIELLTSEPIKGATVSVVGTSLSATTDTNGIYTLPNVLVGVQTVRASLSGFIAEILTVTVNANRTVTANFKLRRIVRCPGSFIIGPRIIGTITEKKPQVIERAVPGLITPAKPTETACVAGRPIIAPKSGETSVISEGKVTCPAGMPIIAPEGTVPEIKPRGRRIN